MQFRGNGACKIRLVVNAVAVAPPFDDAGLRKYGELPLQTRGPQLQMIGEVAVILPPIRIHEERLQQPLPHLGEQGVQKRVLDAAAHRVRPRGNESPSLRIANLPVVRPFACLWVIGDYVAPGPF